MKTTALFAIGGIALTCLLLISCGREAPVGTLEIDSDPPGLRITVNPLQDEAKNAPGLAPVTPHRALLPTGSYVVTPLYEPNEMQVTPSSRIVEVTASQLVRTAFTTARLGRVEVRSTPAGASIRIDGEDSGRITPADLTLTEGEHTIDVHLDGYVLDGSSSTVTIDPDEPASVILNLLPAGFLSVTSDPEGAAIQVDGVDSGATTPSVLTVAAGRHIVRLTRPGWIVLQDSLVVDVPVGDTAEAAFTLVAEGTTGEVVVTSLPAGAAILIDGVPTGEVTPFTFALTPVVHTVELSRAGFHAPEAISVTPIPGGSLPVEATLAARKIVLIETVSGVHCVGCPAMNLMLANVENSGFGYDTMLGIKYSGPFGSTTEQHFEVNPIVLQNRMTYYADNTIWSWAAPTLFFDGALAVAPQNSGYPGFGDMTILLTEAATSDPGFAIEVHVDDWNADPLNVTVDLIPTRIIERPGAVLNFAVVENPIVYAEPQNIYGEDEFHWVCREFTTIDTSPLPISPAAPGHFEVQVPRHANWTGFDLANLFAVVFVQDDVTLEVLQAGAMIPDGHQAAAGGSSALVSFGNGIERERP